MTNFAARMLALVIFFAVAVPNGAQSVSATGPADDPTRQTDADWIDDRWSKTDIGQFLHATIETPRKRTPKAIAIKVGDQGEATVCFDTDLLRYSAVWTGGFLKIPAVRYGLMAAPSPDGEIQFTTEPTPGWAKDVSFEDPRPQKLGPLPPDWAKYKGFYTSGKRVVLSYAVQGIPILESPWFEKIDGIPVFTRTLEISQRKIALSFKIAEFSDAHDLSELRNHLGISTSFLTRSGTTIGIAALSLSGADCSIMAGNSSHNVWVQPDSSPTVIKVIVAKLTPETRPKFVALANSLRTVSSGDLPLASLTKGGPSRWPTLTTTGTVVRADSPLAIDTVTIPYKNPWNALFFTSGHDFFSNGDAAVAAIHGDVWRVSGLDDTLQKVTWKRFATGLYQPLGVKIIQDKVHVIERDQITILHDLDNDGEADYYENFNNDCISAGGSHGYTTCLETDSAGNFYFLKCAENTPHGGTLLKVPRDGSGIEVIATGFRNPNGLGIGPGDLITVADQQGDWVPETRLDRIDRGGFYGFTPMSKRASPPTSFNPPLCWIPRSIDNSAGGQVWIPENKWGMLGGEMLHLSYGRCTMMLVLRDESSTPPIQGAVVPLPGRFASGVCRARFSPADGHLYLTGLRGWQTAAVRDGCFQRVRYRKPLALPIAYSVKSNYFTITFSELLDRELAEDIENYGAETWNYHWSSNYGSPDFSVENPAKQGRDSLKITSAKLQPDGKTVILTLPDLRRAMQLAVNYNLETTNGDTLQSAIYATLNRVE